MTSQCSTTSRVRALNDAFRTGGPQSGQWMHTRGVAERGAEFVILALRAVQQFDAFDPGDDPYGEHDFGAFDLNGERLFWKIDYYDPSLSYGSNAPEDADATSRVLTLMLASEY
ncbi:DUF3768 domain-containing protein [Phenylobacterium sp.]|jgi:hypothetical protein|uniref:DUF3768 domain-containing protein n=1 Tax=Phenylobacterium sp. TaxID=1871053 RepID=UPI000C9507BB|nr:DUF3768 domain-containing protein [Phenylobacterium sp.]MAK83319.1 hypothetical protein [Phenylobacterium sp.]|tara:strand:- start:25050 stop:25391 length:342 start_codon:yes stop_codon:yes gene_type:complete